MRDRSNSNAYSVSVMCLVLSWYVLPLDDRSTQRMPLACSRNVSLSRCLSARQCSAFFGAHPPQSGEVGWVKLSFSGAGGLVACLSLVGLVHKKDHSSVFVMESHVASLAIVGYGNARVEDASIERAFRVVLQSRLADFMDCHISLLCPGQILMLRCSQDQIICGRIKGWCTCLSLRPSLGWAFQC